MIRIRTEVITVASQVLSTLSYSAKEADQFVMFRSYVFIQGDWYTTVDEQGYTYYWNQVTNETSWDPPPDQPPKLVRYNSVKRIYTTGR